MFSKLFTKNAPPKAVTNEPAAISNERLADLMRRFPISSKIRYYPEYKKDIVLDSVVIAYMINDQYIYSHSDLSLSGSGAKEQAVVNINGTSTSLGPARRFFLVIPTSSRSEGDLNYTNREILQQTGGLAPGNSITIMGHQTDGKVPVIDTTVSKRTVIKEGYYANHSVALLEAAPNSFALTDQRAHQRLQVDYPIQISLSLDAPAHGCTLLDFADHAVRIDFKNFDPEQGAKHRDQPLIIRIQLPGHPLFTLRGHIFRREGNEAVVVISSILNQGVFQPVHLVDLMEIKSSLLQTL